MSGTNTVQYHRQPVNDGSVLAATFVLAMYKRLGPQRWRELEIAHCICDALTSHLCWWIEKADIWLNDRVTEDDSTDLFLENLDDYFEDFVNEYIGSVAAEYLQTHVELPIDVATIMDGVVQKRLKDIAAEED